MKKALFFVFLFSLGLTAKAQSDTVTVAIQTRLDDLLAKNADLFSRSQLGLYVYDLDADCDVYKHGWQQRLRPASTEKVITATTALATLGTDYNFSTTLYAQPDSANHVKSVCIVGRMDPAFSSSDMRAFMDVIKACGDTIDGDVILDMSWKDSVMKGWGWCWDDDDEDLMPLLYDGKAKFVPRLEEALRKAHIVVMGRIREVGTAPSVRGYEKVCTRYHSLDTILKTMLKESDNLYAESVFYQIAANAKKPATAATAREQIYRFISKELGLETSQYQIADGSGLSLYNYVTPELHVRLLRWAYKHTGVYNHLRPALPLAGYDGTLRKRMKTGPARGQVMAKTGTVDGVSTLTGYACAPNGHMLAFSIMNQGIRSASIGRNFQDKVCEALTRALGVAPQKTEQPEDGRPEQSESEGELYDPAPL